ncbi:MAG: LTA synthase family protein [Eubacteriales bacterium]
MKFEVQKSPAFYVKIGIICLCYSIVAFALGVCIAVSLLSDLSVLPELLLAAVLSGLLLGAVLSVRIRFTEDTSKVLVVPILMITSVAIFLYMQYIISAGIAWMKLPMLILNVAFLFALQFVLFALCGSVQASVLTVLFISSVVGLIDNLVVQSRSREICFSDFWSISTGMSVVSGYSFTLPTVTLVAIFLLPPFVALIVRTRFWHYVGIKLRLCAGVGGSAVLIVISLLVSTTWGTNLIGFKEQYWKYHASAFNGFYLNLIHTASSTKVSVPSGYSLDGIGLLLKEYHDKSPEAPDTASPNPPATAPETPPETSSGTDPLPGTSSPATDEKEQKPNLIVIMDETFSDLQAVSKWMIANGYDAEELITDVEVLPFWNSLSSDSPNVEKGWAISSVYGGNTANSEFEFLTGNSMAFLPANTVPYNLYLNSENTFSIVDLLNKEGYLTVGMHPEDSDNWSRNKLYSYYGFNRTLFLDDFTDLTDEDYYRGHVSDRAVFNQIIKLYEEKDEGTPLFTFAVTMANHGGYNTEDFESTVSILGHENYVSLQEYLSSIRESDAAICELIRYFESADEDTVIVIFGDHQPNMPDYIYPLFFGIGEDTSSEEWQARYTVPYLIWANFEFEDEQSEITSLNYLSGKMMEIADIEMTDYLEFIASLRKIYPAISAAGYWDNDGVFHSLTGQHAPEGENMLLLYEYLEYNALFDKTENKLIQWFVKEVPQAAATLPETKEQTD